MPENPTAELTPEENLALLTDAVWKQMGGHTEECPPEKMTTFRQLDDLISTTAWGAEARDEFFRRWVRVENACDKSFEVNSFAQLAHLTWAEVCKTDTEVKHPLAPLIHAWHSGPAEVEVVRDGYGALRGDTIMPRLSMREGGGQTDRLYLPPARISVGGDGVQGVLLGFEDAKGSGRIPVLPINLYDLGVSAGEARGGSGAAPIPARMLVKLAAAPSTMVRHHSDRFVTYQITLRDLRDALYPRERLDGSRRRPPTVSEMWPRIRAAIQVINIEGRIPVLDPKTGYGYFHHLLRINENFGRIDLKMPIGVVLDIPPQVTGGVSLPLRLDQWGAESAPAYRALLGLSFLWHEPGRTHAPAGRGRWIRKKGPEPYEPISDADAIDLAYPSSRHANSRLLALRAWAALEKLEEHGELRIDNRRILPPEQWPPKNAEIQSDETKITI